MLHSCSLKTKKFEDTKVVTRSHKVEQKIQWLKEKKVKQLYTNHYTEKLKIEQHEHHQKPVMKSFM